MSSSGASGTESVDSPTIELASKAGELGLLVKVLGHDFICKTLLLENDEATPVGKPSDDIRELFLRENLHHLVRVKETAS